MKEGPHPALTRRPLPAGEVEEPFTSPAGRGRREAAGEGLLTRAQIVASARAWLGTPYVHQASAKGQGTDCLGLLRGLYAELYGHEPEAPPPYTPDWNEARAREEPLLSAARRHLAERAQPSPACGRGWTPRQRRPGEGTSTSGVLALTPPRPRPLSRQRESGEEIRPGQVLIFRIVTTGPAKHCGVAVSEDHFIHAYAGRAVVESWLTRWWIERLAGVFEFPGVDDLPPPSPACGRGSREARGEGASTGSALTQTPPHPRPLSREGRERGEERIP